MALSKKLAAPLATATIAILALASPAASQNKTDSTWVDITTWNYEHLYEEGWSVTELLQGDAYGKSGARVGEIEDLIIGPEGDIRRVVIEGGGFLDIGDSHIAVPWNYVSRRRTASVTVDIVEENLDETAMFRDADDKPAITPNWRVRELLGEYLTLQDGTGFGLVDDVIFGADNTIEAIVVRPSYGVGRFRGPVLFPYNNSLYTPADPVYATPYTKVELEDVDIFDYGRLK